MKKFGSFIVKNRVLVLIISIALLIPSIIGMKATRINYDILDYLPGTLDTVKGQKILDKDFDTAATSMLIMENMPSKDVVKLKEKIGKVKGVEKVIWIDDALDTSVPKEILPEEVSKNFYSKNSTMMIIKFTEASASESTFNAIKDIKSITNKQCFLAGMSSILYDTKELTDKEVPIYTAVAVGLALAVLLMGLESTLVPFIFMIGIGFAIAYNLGSNYFLGEISYVTKAIAAVLQLGVTMDYSIFLLHRYEEEKGKCANREDAMAEAIANTFLSILGSSLTTVAGFLALCTMQLGIGMDMGIVMAKGVLLGVITTVTVLPAMVMFFDNAIHKYTHKTILPEFKKVSNFVVDHSKLLAVLFVAIFIPFIYAQNNTKVYYNLDESLPKDLYSVVSTNKLKNDYKMTTTHFIIVKDNIVPYKMTDMIKRIEKLDGIEGVLAYDKFIGNAIPESFMPNEVKDIFKKDGYNLIIANSKYKAATDEENDQIDKIITTIREYDEKGIVAGEGPLTKDLIKIADKDFKSVNFSSTIAIFVIVLFVFMSFSVPIVLVLAIEFAIAINLGIPYFTGSILPFIASIVIGTVQLGATVDYAILLTTRFREEIRNGHEKHEAMKTSVQECSKSIVISAMTFFSATIGVYVISKMELIKSLCLLMSRGALISMFTIIFLLPPLLIIFEGPISKTSRNWRNLPRVIKNKKEEAV